MLSKIIKLIHSIPFINIFCPLHHTEERLLSFHAVALEVLKPVSASSLVHICTTRDKLREIYQILMGKLDFFYILYSVIFSSMELL